MIKIPRSGSSQGSSSEGSSSSDDSSSSSGGSSPPGGSFSGTITMEQMRSMGWHLTDSQLSDLNRCCKMFDITTSKRIRHFIAQCSHESSCGFYTKKIASGEEYNNRPKLGNIYPGDGQCYKGGGYVQLTGRNNYRDFANYIGDQDVMLGVDYVAAHYPWTSAGYWWYQNGMNARCDKGATVEQITFKVNGGYNGLEDLRKYYKRACNIF